MVLWCVRYKITFRDLAEMLLERGVVFTHEAVRQWEAKLASVKDSLHVCLQEFCIGRAVLSDL